MRQTVGGQLDEPRTEMVGQVLVRAITKYLLWVNTHPDVRTRIDGYCGV